MPHGLSLLLLPFCFVACVADLSSNTVTVASKSSGWFSLFSDGITSLLQPAIFSSPSSGNALTGTETTELDHPPVTAADLKQLELHMDAAKAMLQNGQYQESADELFEVLRIAPDDLEGNSLLGALLLTLQQYEPAEALLYKAVHLSEWKDSASVSNLAQNVLVTSGDVELAMKILAKGLAAANNDDSSGTLSFTMGDVLYKKKEYNKAAEWYLSAAVKKPGYAAAWVKASTIRFPDAGKSSYKFMENVLLQGLAANEDSATLYFHLGLLMYSTNRIKEALTFYDHAVRLDPSNAEALAAFATALHSQGHHNPALQFYRAAEALAPNNYVLLSNYALLMRTVATSMEELQFGLALAERAVALNAANADAQHARQVLKQDIAAVKQQQ